MKKLFINTMLAGAIALSASAASAQGEVFSDDFESYADDAAFDAAWSLGGNSDATLLVATEELPAHSGTQFVQHPASGLRQGRSFPSTQPTDAQPLVLDFWIRPTVALQGRAVVGLGTGTNSPVMEFGNYNSPAGTGWFARVVGGGPSPSTWTHLGGTRVANQWTNLKAVLKSNVVEFFEDGVSIGSIQRTTTAFPELNAVYFGINATATDQAHFDDIVITTTSSVSDWSMY